MNIFRNIGKILFDEEVEEVPADSNDLPDKNKKKKTMGFVDHTDTHVEEDTITEVKVPVDDVISNTIPKVEKTEEVITQQTRSFKLPSDDEFDDIPLKEEVKEFKEIRETNNLTNTQPISRVNRFNIEQPKQSSSISDLEPRKNYRVEQPKPKLYEEKDYKKILNEDKLKNSKKPFHVTPVISPVYGILDKNYKPEEVVKRTNITPPINAFTTFSSVNVDPGTPKVSLKDNLLDINSEITEMMNDSVKEEEEKEVALPSREMPISAPVRGESHEEEKVEEVKYESRVNKNKIDIEDAFDTTSEIDQIHEEEKEVYKEPERVIEEHVDAPRTIIEDNSDDEVIDDDDYEIIKNNDEVINNDNDDSDNESEEDKNLENTIETDLFNLINSMYSNDDDEEDEE